MLALAYVAMIVCGIAVVVEAFVSFQTIASHVGSYVAASSRVSTVAGQLRTYEAGYVAAIRLYTATGDGTYRLEASGAESDARRAGAALQTYLTGQELAAWNEHLEAISTLFQAGNTATRLARAGTTGQDARQADGTFEAAVARVDASWNQLTAVRSRSGDGVAGAVADEITRALSNLLLIGALFLFLAASYALGQRISHRRMSRALSNVLHRIASGDVETPLDPRFVAQFGTVGQAAEAMRQAIELSHRESMSQGFKQEALQRQLTLYARDLHDALQRERVMVAKLRELDQLKSEFVSMVSHELKNPIAAIHGYARIMLDHADRLSDTQRTEFIRVISQESDHLHTLVDDVLLTSRIESDTLTYQFQPVDASPILRSIVEETQMRTDNHEITLVGGEVVHVLWGDPTRIRQVFVNLIGNAVKYSPHGGTVTVTIDRDRERRLARVTIADQGLGMTEQDLARLFQKFGRIQSDATAEIPGTGLGLYIAKQIVDAHRGTIAVSSAPGQGTTFTVELPLDPASDGMRISGPDTRRSLPPNMLSPLLQSNLTKPPPGPA